MTTHDLDTFVAAYTECALWSSCDDESNPLDDRFGEDDLSDHTREVFLHDCKAFVDSNLKDLAALDAGQAGHDFWLTRNRHGAGFWDHGLGDVGERLTDAAHAFGERNL